MSCLTVWLNMICVQCLQRSLEVTDAQEQELRMVVYHTGAGNTLRFFAWELISILNDWAPALTATHQLKSGIDDIKQLQSLQVNAWWDSDEGILWFNHLLIEKVEHFWKILTYSCVEKFSSQYHAHQFEEMLPESSLPFSDYFHKICELRPRYMHSLRKIYMNGIVKSSLGCLGLAT